MATDVPAPRRARRTLLWITAGLIGLAILLWQASPLAGLATEEQLADWLTDFRGAWWAPFAMLLVYIAAGLVEFPVVLLIATTALLFEPLTALATSLAGGLASSLVFYWIGARFTRGTMEAALGRTLQRVQGVLARGGILTIVVLRSIPFAPFSVVNLAAGSLGIPLRDYLIGTALGLLPGILVLTIFGEQLRAAWGKPGSLGMVGLAVLLWVAVVWGLQRWARRKSTKVSDGLRRSPKV